MVESDEGFTVAQVSAVTGVSAHTLRYYERSGLIRPVARTAGNQRRYSEPDIDWVLFLLRLRETGMSIAHMREYAALREQGSSTAPARVQLLVEHQQRLLQRIDALQLHESALAEKIAWYRNSGAHGARHGIERSAK